MQPAPPADSELVRISRRSRMPLRKDTWPDPSDIASTRNRTGERGHVLDFIFGQHHPAAMTWQVGFHDEFVPEFRNLPGQVQDEVYAVSRLLEQFGP